MACPKYARSATSITDRAKRYRAQACAPAGPRQCALCPSRRFLVVDHRDGDESNGARSNLRWLCKSCNTRLGKRDAREGRGVRTRQYNPADTGAAGLGEYVSALRILKGEMAGDFDKARAVIHATSASARSRFAREIAAKKTGRSSGMATVRALLGNPAYTLYSGENSAGDERWYLEWIDDSGHKHEEIFSSYEAAVRRKSQLQRRNNPADTAADLAEAFHGRPSVAEEIDVAVHEHTHLAGLGTLDKIILKGGDYITFDGDVILASNEAGTQLFIEGGDQSIGLADFPEVDDSKESVVLGRVQSIYYTADKHHLSKAERKPSAYKHRLGEESGDLPVLLYDTRNRLLSFAGGHYYVGRSMDGGHSEGIVD